MFTQVLDIFQIIIEPTALKCESSLNNSNDTYLMIRKKISWKDHKENKKI